MRLEHSERLSAQRALPLGGERTGEKRSGARGSADGATGTPEGRVAVRLTLPLGVERTESARPRGEWQCAWYAQGRVEVQFTLPLGVERTGWNAQGRVAVRIGTPGPEWQCNRYVEGRVAVRTARRVRPRGEWQCAWYAQGRVEVQFTLPLGVERTGWSVQARVAVRPVRPKASWESSSGMAAVPTTPRDTTLWPDDRTERASTDLSSCKGCHLRVRILRAPPSKPVHVERGRRRGLGTTAAFRMDADACLRG